MQAKRLFLIATKSRVLSL